MQPVVRDPGLRGRRDFVKDFDRSGGDEQHVAETDAPVITSNVAPSGPIPPQSDIGPVVEAAFDAHASGLKAFAVAAVRDQDAADDLVQETFIRFVRHTRHEGVPDNVPAWLHRVCGNLIISHLRRRGVSERKKALLVDTSVGASPEEHAIRMDEGAHLLDAMGQLPPDARAALLMAAAGFSPTEIGDTIGRSANATSTYICRARVRLRELLSPAGEPER